MGMTPIRTMPMTKMMTDENPEPSSQQVSFNLLPARCSAFNLILTGRRGTPPSTLTGLSSARRSFICILCRLVRHHLELPSLKLRRAREKPNECADEAAFCLTDRRVRRLSCDFDLRSGAGAPRPAAIGGSSRKNAADSPAHRFENHQRHFSCRQKLACL